MKKILSASFIMVMMIFTACSKDNDKSDNENPPDGTVAKGTITNLTFTNNGAANPSLINLDNNGTPVGNYSATNGGPIQLKISGKEGRDLLKAEDVFILSSNRARWHINAGDTVRVYQSGSLKGEYITAKGDGYNDGILFSIDEGETQDHAMTRLNTYVKTTLPAQQFKEF